ncbi:hypothetical protein BBAD15_g1579 [Beauveria bassiana D1-5]|uniref:Uncharacterized protein n=1 Tax=Beauveria bassiana D1-5 TaxID=1245745 RepID=A0A0A2WHV9_BEABA|nr:hypothetical protein BBAD15_g1579 [Beauveria bassiana D1-5]
MSQRRRKPSSRHSLDIKDNIAPIGYVLEWTAPHPHHRHRLDTVDNLRSELLGGPPSGVQQLIVLRGDAVLDTDVSEALRNLAGVDSAFIEAFAQQGAPCRRPRGPARWWTARYPEETTTDGGKSVMMRRAALWPSSQVPVLLVDTPLVEEEEEEADEAERKRRRRRKVEAPRLTHQDAATRRSALQHGAAAPRRHGALQLAGPASTVTLDDELASAIDHAQQQVIALEEMLAELVHDRWTARLGALPLDAAAGLLWSYAVALERNLDDDDNNVRRGTRQSLRHVGPAAAAWTELSQRVQLRIQLAAAAAVTATARPPSSPPATAAAAAAAAADPDSDTRSLDRIAYLGAALLPVSIVSGVLAVEGRYGPGGAQFWVFWVASVVAVAAALGFVWLDRLRLAEVWIEMPTSSGNGGGGGGVAAAAAEEAAAGGFVADGDRMVRAASAWRRERMGWGRAMKKVSGYYRLRGARWIRFRKPVRAEEKWKDWKDDVIVVEEE